MQDDSIAKRRIFSLANLPRYILCILLPHIMFPIGLYMVCQKDCRTKERGKFFLVTSTFVMAIGSFLYLVFYTPLFTIDF